MKTSGSSKKTADLLLVNEAIVKYVRDMDNAPFAGIQIQDMTFSDFFDHKMLVVATIRRGIPYELFEAIQSITPFDENEWADYLNVSTKTLQRHRKEKNYRFKAIHTEKIIELAEVTNLGHEVFDSKDQFHLWLITPSYALGNLKPSELLKDSYGKEMVMGELNRIEHGIFV